MPFVHEKATIVSEAHLDSFGHMNNARYLEVFEQARWDLVTARGFGMAQIRETGTGPVILEVAVKFLRELSPREAIVVRSQLLSYERKIGRLCQQILKSDGTVACDALFTFALFDLQRRKLIEPTPAWAYAVGLEHGEAAADASSGQSPAGET